ncbi:unnamed protein product [Penicillium pancosmium]
MDVLEVGLDYIPTWSSPLPACLLCGNVIRSALQCAPLKSFQKAIGRQLKRNSEQDQVLVPAKEVEEQYLVNFPWLSACTFRAIASDTDGRFHLTGICIADYLGNPNNFAVVPKDSSMARIGARGGETVVLPRILSHDPAFTLFRLRASSDVAPEEQTSSGIGYLLHAHCWVLLGRRICEPIHIEMVSLDLNHLVHAAKSLRGVPSTWWYERGYAPLSNPLIIPRIHNAISLAERTITRTRGAKTSALRLIQSTQSVPSTHPMNTLPLDIATMIAELVCPPIYNEWQAMTLRNLLSVFDWVLPECFWRRRIDENAFFELQDIQKSNTDTHVDWQVLRLELMQLQGYRLKHHCGLELRKYVLKNLREVMSAYAKSKVEESSLNSDS